MIEFGPKKVETPKKDILDSYSICITNFNFLAPFGGELYEEKTQEMVEMKKPDQKTTSLRLRGVEIGLKSRYPQKAYLEHLLNVQSVLH